MADRDIYAETVEAHGFDPNPYRSDA